MRKSLGAVVALTALTAAALPAVANAQADTTLTVIIASSGGLSIAAPASATVEADEADAVPIYAFTVNQVTVTDSRNSLLGWTSTAALPGGLTNAAAGETVPGSAFTYVPGLAVPGLGSIAVVTPGLPGNLNAPRTAQTAAISLPLFGQNRTASWTPLVTVPTSNFSGAGTYTGTLTHSVA